jgi:FKBP-type peptidyl-prolyl cis-trans isomerase
MNNDFFLEKLFGFMDILHIKKTKKKKTKKTKKKQKKKKKKTKKKNLKKKKKKKKNTFSCGCWKACFSKLQALICKRGGRKEVLTNKSSETTKQ